MTDEVDRDRIPGTPIIFGNKVKDWRLLEKKEMSKEELEWKLKVIAKVCKALGDMK